MLSARVELLAVLVSGLAGSVHCLGICGSIAASMSLGAGGLRGALIRQLFWGTGRIVTYVFWGLCAAAAGTKLLRLQSGLAILAGVFDCAGVVCSGLDACSGGSRAGGQGVVQRERFLVVFFWVARMPGHLRRE